MQGGVSPERRFDVGELEARFAVLERLGRGLWLPAIVNSQGLPLQRLHALGVARERLIAGEQALQTGDEWPQPDLVAAFSAAMAGLPLDAVAKSNEEVCDQVLRSLLANAETR